MKEKTKKIVARCRPLATWVTSRKIPIHSAHTGFFMVLAMFPTLMLLLGFLRYTGLQPQTLIDLLQELIPEALMPLAKKLVLSAYQNTSGMVLSISAVTVLWSASRGMYGLVRGLNSVYSVKESRNWLYTRLYSMLYTFAFLVLLVITLLLDVFGEKMLSYWPAQWPSEVLQDVLDLRFFVLLILQTMLFAVMYTVLPNRRSHFIESLPGAMLAAVGWQVFSDLYSIYVARFTGYSNIYGSVYAVALSMMWLYFCISILFYGGALNAFLAEHDNQSSGC